MSDVIRLNREQSILVVRALKAVELLGYKKAEEICLEDFKETDDQVCIQIIDYLSNDIIDITITKGDKNAPTN